MSTLLFEGEEFRFSDSKVVNLSDKEICERYVKGDTRIITEQGRYPLETVVKMFSDKTKYDDMVEYQRNYVWKDEKKSLLIESFIMNIPIPPIFLYEKSYSYYEVLDGKQRIKAIVDFYSDKFPLTGLTLWSELNGRRYSDLPLIIRQGLDRRYLSSIIMLKESSLNNSEMLSLKNLVFQRLNSGGVKLNAQESRNAFYPGNFTDLCKSIAKSSLFRSIWKKKKTVNPISLIEDDSNDNGRMQLDEIVLRFFAFRQIDKFNISLSLFLDKYLEYANANYDSALIDKLKDLFFKTLEMSYSLFEGKPFRLAKQKGSSEEISLSASALRVVYDPAMQVFSRHLSDSAVLYQKRAELQHSFYEVMVNKKELFNGKLTHRALIEKRIDEFETIVKGVING